MENLTKIFRQGEKKMHYSYQWNNKSSDIELSFTYVK